MTSTYAVIATLTSARRDISSDPFLANFCLQAGEQVRFPSHLTACAYICVSRKRPLSSDRIGHLDSTQTPHTDTQRLLLRD